MIECTAVHGPLPTNDYKKYDWSEDKRSSLMLLSSMLEHRFLGSSDVYAMAKRSVSVRILGTSRLTVRETSCQIQFYRLFKLIHAIRAV